MVVIEVAVLVAVEIVLLVMGIFAGPRGWQGPGVRALKSTESAMEPAKRALVYVGSQSWLGGP